MKKGYDCWKAGKKEVGGEGGGEEEGKGGRERSFRQRRQKKEAGTV